MPARESRTGARLVSPAAGCEKKKDASRTGTQNTKLSTLKHVIGTHRQYREWYNLRKVPSLPESEWKNICLECLSIFGLFFLHPSHQSMEATHHTHILKNPNSTRKIIWLKTWKLFKSLQCVTFFKYKLRKKAKFKLTIYQSTVLLIHWVSTAYYECRWIFWLTLYV